MRKYLFGTGIIGAISSGITLLRGVREEQFTWRTVVAWLSWGLSLALAIGTIVEVRRDTRDLSAARAVADRDATDIPRRRR